jgi:hypothetical protein
VEHSTLVSRAKKCRPPAKLPRELAKDKSRGKNTTANAVWLLGNPHAIPGTDPSRVDEPMLG